MKTPLKNHFALVTGAGRGIGAAVALELARKGCNLILLSRTESELKSVTNQCNDLLEDVDGKAVYLSIDLADMEKINELVLPFIEKEFEGKLDIMILNAGISGHGSALSADLEKWDACIDLNLRSCMHLTRLCLPKIVERAPFQSDKFDTPDRVSGIIYIGSVAGIMTMKGSSAYCASKFGVNGLAGSVFEDVREYGIKVSVLNPGYVNTPLVGKTNLDTGRMIQPQDIADASLFVLLSPKTVCCTELVIRPQRTPYV